LELLFGTQILVPSKAGWYAPPPTVTVCRMAAEPSSFRRVPWLELVTQTFAPSERAPAMLLNGVVTVVTVQGGETPGVTIEIDPPEGGPTFAVQIRDPSNVIASGKIPIVAT